MASDAELELYANGNLAELRRILEQQQQLVKTGCSWRGNGGACWIVQDMI